MAKIVSPVWSTIRGSIAGTTYFPNQYGQIIARQRTTPVNPGTLRQTQMRGAFGVAAVQWRSLTQVQRDAWNDYAATCAFGYPQGYYYIPGREMFVRNIGTTIYLRTRGEYTAAIDPTAPTWNFPSFGLLDTVDPSASQTGFTVQAQVGGPFLDGLMYGWVSRAVNPTVNFWKGPFLTETLVSNSHTFPGNLATLEFNGLSEGYKYFFKCGFITEDGDPSICQLALPFIGSATAVAVGP